MLRAFATSFLFFYLSLVFPKCCLLYLSILLTFQRLGLVKILSFKGSYTRFILSVYPQKPAILYSTVSNSREPLKCLFQAFAVLCFICAISVLYGVTRRNARCDREAVPWRWLDAQEFMDMLLRIEYVADVPM